MARIAPDRAALEVAHRLLMTAAPLDAMLKNATLKIVLEIVASRHMARRAQVDVKKLQANDRD
jgi:heme oxygenase